MKDENQKLRLGIYGVLIFASFMPFVIGIILSIDGFTILANKHRYEAGVLRIDSLSSGATGAVSSGDLQAIGYVDSVYTGLHLEKVESPKTQALLRELGERKEAFLPVWYKPDGKLTIHRFEDESSFPVCRVAFKLVLYLVCFNLPFLVVSVLYWRLRRLIQRPNTEPV